MIFWMAYRSVKDIRDLDRLLLCGYIAAIVMALIGLGAALGMIQLAGAWEEGHIRSTLQYHNALAIYLAAMSMAGIAFYLKASRPLSRALYTAGNYLLLLVIMGTLSRGTWLLYPLILAGYFLLIPAEYRHKAGYHLLLVVGTGIITGRFLFNYISASQETMAALSLLAGLFLIIGFSFLKPGHKVVFARKDSTTPSNYGKTSRFNCKWIKAGNPASQKYFAAAIGGLLLIIVVYLSVSHSFTGLAHYLMPDTVINRASQSSLQNHSFSERLVMYKEAAAIIKDSPVLGAGGGGWQALYHSYADYLYWSSEVHNFYLKTWLEAGLLGLLAILAAAVLFIRMLIKAYSRTRSGIEGVSFWAASLAISVIALHSFIDFELSMPAIGFLFFALLGAWQGSYETLEINKQTNKKLGKLSDSLRGKQAAGITAATLLALAALASSGSAYIGSDLADRGAQAMGNKQLQTAFDLYQKASIYDPWQSVCQVNLARIKAIDFKSSGQVSDYNQALIYAGRAAQLEPYNPNLHKDLMGTYGLLGRPDLQLKEARAIINANPFLPEPYNDLVGLAMPAAWVYLDKGDMDEAGQYFGLVLEVRRRAPAVVVKACPGFNLAAGQSALLSGDITSARTYLQEVRKQGGKYRGDAELWLAGADFMANRTQSGKAAGLNELRIFLSNQSKLMLSPR